MKLYLSDSSLKGRNDVGRSNKCDNNREVIIRGDIYVSDTADVVSVMCVADDYDRAMVDGKYQEVIVLKNLKSERISAISKAKFLRASKLPDAKVPYRYVSLLDGNVRPLLRTLRLNCKYDLYDKPDDENVQCYSHKLKDFVKECFDDGKIPRLLIDISNEDNLPLYERDFVSARFLKESLNPLIESAVALGLGVRLNSLILLVDFNEKNFKFINVYILNDTYSWRKL